MRYIKLFENFDQLSGEEISSLTFDWLPLDTEVNNPMNESMPESLGAKEAIELCQSKPEIEKLGRFIAHSKMPSGGFIRYVIKSTNPVLIDSAVFDSQFKKIRENLNIDALKIDLGKHSKGISTLNRFGLFDED